MMRIAAALGLLFCSLIVSGWAWDFNDPCSDPSVSGFPYCDPARSHLDRAVDLVSRLTLQEKVSLTITFTNPIDRLRVPPFDTTECLRGTASAGSPLITTTSFPQAIANAASFNVSLLHAIASATSNEVRAKTNEGFRRGQHGVEFGNICWSPVVNICRDPRWGRCQETYGEDPYLTSAYAHQYVRGLQEGDDRKYLKAVSTCKHFDVHGGPEDIPSSRFTFDSVVSDRDWVTTFQPAFEACAQAGVQSYMCSYNEINGIPACANYQLLTQIARETWNFTGYVVGDCGAVGNIYSQHNWTHSYEEAVGASKRAGVDWDCGGEVSWYSNAVQEGILTRKELDSALIRFLSVQMHLGVFDSPSRVSYKTLTAAGNINTPAHQALAREAARQDIVLLENRGSILPIPLASGKIKVAVIGPNANNASNLLGDYSPVPPYVVTPLQAIREIVPNPSENVLFATGCADVFCTDPSGFAAAVNAAAQADVAILFMGTNSYYESEGNDRPNITLPGLQEGLIKAITALSPAGVRVIVVFINGGALSSPYTSARADALLEAFFGGQEAGHGIVDVLTGAFNPGGRLPYTVQMSDAQLPPMTDYNMSASAEYPGRTYRYLQQAPLYGFGYGLSYTAFSYAALRVNPVVVKPCQSVLVSAQVTNTGLLPGSEAMQVYIQPTNSSIPWPLIQLVAFDRVFLNPNQSKVVTFKIEPYQMSVVREYDFERELQPIKFNLFVGGGLPSDPKVPSNTLTGGFAIQGAPILVAKCN